MLDGTVILGGRDRMVHALDATTGKPKWEVHSRARIDSSPAIAGTRAFVGSQRRQALRARPGQWKSGVAHEDGAALTSSPALASGRVVIGSTEGRVLCFE